MIDVELLQKAILLTQKGNTKEAKTIYDTLLEKNPDDVNLLSVYGLFYINIGNFDKACEILYKAYSKSKSFGTVSALGLAEFERRNFFDAANILEESLNYGANPDIYNKLISCLFEIRNYEKAINFAEIMFQKYPKDLRAIANKVKALTQTGKMLEAEKLCVESLRTNPDSGSLWFHLGFLKELIYCNNQQAKECYKMALELGYKEAEYNIAVSCYKLKEFEDAEKHYRTMLTYYPNDTNTLTSLGMCLLTQKKFTEGYNYFFQRDNSKFKDLSTNFWKFGDKLDNEINIICDQGYGDHIMFSRYFAKLQNKKVNVGTRKALIKLFQDNFREINFVPYEELNPKIQTIFITDLPYILELDFDHIPSSKGYLSAKPLELKNNKLKVGLCWEAGSAAIRTMIHRTVNIKFFENILNLKNIQVYSFQVEDTLNGNSKYPQMINLAKNFNDFYDTASALKSMDVLISVDTSVAHLAGALGVKTFLLLPYTSDWRWFNDNDTTSWYDSVKIFKQEDSLSWEKELNAIQHYLKNSELFFKAEN